VNLLDILVIDKFIYI